MTSQGGAIREKLTVRRFPESKVLYFGLALAKEDWGLNEDKMTVDKMVGAFLGHNNIMVEKFFPTKVVMVLPEEKPYLTEELRHLNWRRKQTYSRHGRRGLKYITLKDTFDRKLKKA